MLRARGIDPNRSGGAIGRASARAIDGKALADAQADHALLTDLLANGGAYPSLKTGGLTERATAAGFALGRMPVLEGSKAVFILATSPVVIAGLANAAKAGLAALRGGLNRLSNVRTRQQAEAWLKDIGHQAPSGASPTATADDLVAFQRTPEWRTLTPAEQGIILQATRQAGIAGRPLAVTLAPAAPEAPPDVDVPDYEPVPLEPPADPPEIPEPFRRAFPGEDEPGIGPNPLEEPEEAPEPSPLVEPETEPREPAPTPLIEPLPEPFIPDPQREPTPRPEPAIAPAEEPETEPREPAPTPLIEPLPEPLIPDPQREPTPRPEPDIGPAPLVEPETEPREPAPTPLIEPLPEPFIPDPQREPTPRPEPAIAPAREPQTEPAPPTEPATETATEPGPITEGALGGPPFTGTAINATPEAGPGPRQAPFPFPGIGPAPADPGPFGLDEIDIVGGPGGFPGFGVPPGLPRLREPGPARTGTPYRPLIRKGKGRGAGRQVPSRPGRYPEWTGRRQGFGYKYVNHQTGEEVFSRNRAPGIPVTKGKGSARKSFRVLSRSSKKPRFPVDYMGATNAHINGGIVYKRSRKAKKRNNTRRRR